MGRLIYASIESPRIEEQLSTGSGSGGNWIVTVYDNDTNTVDEVMTILMIATSCDAEEAAMETWEVHHLGKSVVHQASQRECERVANVIAQIGLEVRVNEE